MDVGTAAAPFSKDLEEPAGSNERDAFNGASMETLVDLFIRQSLQIARSAVRPLLARTTIQWDLGWKEIALGSARSRDSPAHEMRGGGEDRESRDRILRSLARATLERFRWRWANQAAGQEGSCQFAPAHATSRTHGSNGHVLRLLLLHAPSSNDDWPAGAQASAATAVVDADPDCGRFLLNLPESPRQRQTREPLLR